MFQRYDLIYSKIPAAPIPTPIHIVTIPYFVSGRFFISESNLPTSIAPVAPSGCPNAIAPPLTFVFSTSKPVSLIEANVWDANASFNSTKSISSTFKFACFNTSVIAYAGPIPITVGYIQTSLKPTNLAIGSTPSAFTFSPDITTTKPVPSVKGAEEPAVTVPSALKTVGNLDNVS